MSSGISMAVIAVDRVDGLDGALLLAGAVGSLVTSAEKPEPSDERTREMAIRRHRELVGLA